MNPNDDTNERSSGSDAPTARISEATEKLDAPLPERAPDYTPAPEPRDVEMARRLATARDDIKREIGQVIIGQQRVVDLLLVSLFAGGHALYPCLLPRSPCFHGCGNPKQPRVRPRRRPARR